MAKIVHVVHCVDAEGPLYESLETTFERLRELFGVSAIEPSRENLQKLQRGEIPLNGREALVQQAFSPHLVTYLEDWGSLTAMLTRVMSESFRRQVPDSFGGPYRYNWFCVDHVGYEVNPRRRTMGYHAIFDHYRELLRRLGETRDGLHWHAHTMSMYREAHRCATSLLNSPHIWEGLARRVIERRWFPACARVGFQTERPDIHWFLEQYIPFDFSNTSVEDRSEWEVQADLVQGRFADWRLARKDWGVYHPSHDNYQLPGACRRWIARALNILNRFANLTAVEVEKAFRQAQEGHPTLLAIASHDFRDLGAEAECLHKTLVDTQAKFPDVKFRYCEAIEAFRAVAHDGVAGEPLKLQVRLHRQPDGKPTSLTVDTVRGRVFGPQPFLAIATRSRRFVHDNLDFSTDLRSWRYVFDAESVVPEDVAAIGVAANDQYGHTCVEVISA